MSMRDHEFRVPLGNRGIWLLAEGSWVWSTDWGRAGFLGWYLSPRYKSTDYLGVSEVLRDNYFLLNQATLAISVF